MLPPDHPFAERVRELIPINSLDARLQDELLASGEAIAFRRRKVVFSEGERDPYAFYLLDGELELQSEHASPVTVRAGEDNARRALAQLRPRKYTARTTSNVTVFRIERAVLDHVLTNEHKMDDGDAVHIEELDEEDEDADWMSRLLSSELFTRLPPDHIQRFFTELEPLAVGAGNFVLEQGAPGDYLYILAEGSCEVTRRAPGGNKDLRLALLKEGDVFGEESLISNSPRNASVKMLGDGVLMRLAKRAFVELVSKPTLKSVAYSEACQIVAEDGTWLDVRFPDEHETDGIEGSTNVPLNVLRQQASGLDHSRNYVLYCDTGARAATGAFLLAKYGIQARYLAGGLLHSPLGEAKRAAGPAAPAAGAPAAPQAQQAPKASPKPKAAATPVAEPPEPAPRPAAELPPAALAEFQSNVARLGDELKTALAEVAEHKRRREQDIAKFKSQFGQLKTDRDEQAARGAKAVAAARDLKHQHEKAVRAAQAEAARRESAEQAAEAATAEAERRLEMERARLQGDLETLGTRLRDMEQGHRASLEEITRDRDDLRAQLAEAGRGQGEVEALKDQAEAARAAAEVAYEARISELKVELEKAAAIVTETEAGAETLREQLDAAQSRAEEALRSRDERDSELDDAATAAMQRTREDEARLASERERLEAEQAELEGRRTQDRQAREQEAGALAERVAAAAEQAEALDRREMAMEERSAALQAELVDRESALESGEQALATTEAALRAEKADWETKIQEAVVQERGRVEQDRTRLDEEQARQEAARQEQEALLQSERESVEADLAAREQSVVEAEAAFAEDKAAREAEFEETLAKARAQVEGMYSNFREEVKQASEDLAGQRVEALRETYETRLAEQRAMMEDARGQLETETVRLRQALAESQRTNKVPEASPAAATLADRTQSDDTSDWLVVPGQEEEPAPPPAATAPEPAPSDPEPKPAPEPKSARDRVLNPGQLADIRKKMQEKMRAHKSGAA